jgi:hypothetical protein
MSASVHARIAVAVGCALAIGWCPGGGRAQAQPAVQVAPPAPAAGPRRDAIPLAPGEGEDPRASDVGVGSAAAGEADAELDRRVANIDRALADIKRLTRAYYFTWIAITTLVIGNSVRLALLASDERIRGNNIVTASLAGASMTGLLLLPSPGRYASARYRALPHGTQAEKRAKLSQGERWLQQQARTDAFGTSWIRHMMAVVLAGGAGLGLALGYEDNVRGAVRVALLTFAGGELQIWTRPVRSIRYAKEHVRSETPSQLSFAPLAARYALGLQLFGRF